MKKSAYRAVVATALVIVAAGTLAQTESIRLLQISPDEVVWIQSPGGWGQQATLVGNPSKPGTYITRGKIPPGSKIQPHFHPDERVGTVLSGTFYVGYGEKFDESKMRPLPAGSIWTEPAKQPHFAWAKDGEVIIQIMGNGPSGVTPVTTSDK